jgi:hypothetical protein
LTDNVGIVVKTVTVNARPAPEEAEAAEAAKALNAVAAENAFLPTLIKLKSKPGLSSANDLGTYGHLFEPCKNVFEIDASSLSSSDVTYASSKPQVASFLTKHLGICNVDATGETVITITIKDPTSTIEKQFTFTLMVSDKFLIASPDSSSEKLLESGTPVTLTPYFYTLDQNTVKLVKLDTTPGGSEMSSSSSNPPLQSRVALTVTPPKTTTYYLSFTNMWGRPAEITTTVYVIPTQAQPQAAAKALSAVASGSALGSLLPTPSAAAEAAATLSKTSPASLSQTQVSAAEAPVVMEMGGRRRTKRNANRNAISISKRRNGDQKRPTKKNIKNIPLRKSRSTRRRK